MAPRAYSAIAGRLGIGLAPVGITLNDFRDCETGPNNLQNFPYLNDAVNNGPTTIVFGKLSSSFNTQFVLDFYSSPACSQRGMGDRKTYLGSINVATSGRFTSLEIIVHAAADDDVISTALVNSYPLFHVGINNNSIVTSTGLNHQPVGFLFS